VHPARYARKVTNSPSPQRLYDATSSYV